ncbi:MAG: pantetheine-phosphate adenylyltransferase [Ruminococcaceae bacterium]|nr:pantetheine-phosphate adenylyltransferase [Oscillospiraceae bacterium]
MKRVLLPGTYDPITEGHMDVIKRCAKLFDEIYVVIMDNPEKAGKHMFSAEKRYEMLKDSLAGIYNARADLWHGMLVDYVKEKEITFIVKGIRNADDLLYEQNMARINKALYPDAETFFITADEKLSHISSTFARELIEKRGDLCGIIPEGAVKHICFGE